MSDVDAEVERRYQAFKQAQSPHTNKPKPPSSRLPLQKYFDVAHRLHTRAADYVRDRNYTMAYVFLKRFAWMVISTIPKHNEAGQAMHAREMNWCKEQGERSVDTLEYVVECLKAAFREDIENENNPQTDPEGEDDQAEGEYDDDGGMWVPPLPPGEEPLYNPPPPATTPSSSFPGGFEPPDQSQAPQRAQSAPSTNDFAARLAALRGGASNNLGRQSSAESAGSYPGVFEPPDIAVDTPGVDKTSLANGSQPGQFEPPDAAVKAGQSSSGYQPPPPNAPPSLVAPPSNGAPPSIDSPKAVHNRDAMDKIFAGLGISKDAYAVTKGSSTRSSTSQPTYPDIKPGTAPLYKSDLASKPTTLPVYKPASAVVPPATQTLEAPPKYESLTRQKPGSQTGVTATAVLPPTAIGATSHFNPPPTTKPTTNFQPPPATTKPTTNFQPPPTKPSTNFLPPPSTKPPSSTPPTSQLPPPVFPTSTTKPTTNFQPPTTKPTTNFQPPPSTTPSAAQIKPSSSQLPPPVFPSPSTKPATNFQPPPAKPETKFIPPPTSKPPAHTHSHPTHNTLPPPVFAPPSGAPPSFASVADTSKRGVSQMGGNSAKWTPKSLPNNMRVNPTGISKPPSRTADLPPSYNQISKPQPPRKVVPPKPKPNLRPIKRGYIPRGGRRYMHPQAIRARARDFCVQRRAQLQNVRAIRHSFSQHCVQKSKAPLPVEDITCMQYVPQEAFLTNMRDGLRLAKNREKQKGWHFYANNPPGLGGCFDATLVDDMLLIFKIKAIQREVQREKAFFGRIANSRVYTPAKHAPLSQAQVHKVCHYLHDFPVSCVLATIKCPLTLHTKDNIEYNVEVGNYESLVDERYLDNFCVDFLLADLNRRYLMKGYLFFPTLFQMLAECGDFDSTEKTIGTALAALRRFQSGSLVLRGIFIPFLRGAHWSLGIVSFERRRLEYFDSLQYGPPSGLPNMLSAIAQSVARKVRGLQSVNTSRVHNRSREWNGGHKQGISMNGRRISNSGSCGSIMLRGAETLAQSNSLRWGYEEVQYWRIKQMIVIQQYPTDEVKGK